MGPEEATDSSVPGSQGFISEILGCYEEVQINDVMTMIQQVGSKILDLKFEVKEMIESTYVDFSQCNEHTKLVEESENLSREIKDISERIENETKQNLQNSTKELKNLRSCLQEVQLSSSIVNQFVLVDEALKSAIALQSNNEHYETAKALQRAKEMLSKAKEHNQDVQLFEALSEEASLIGGVFIEELVQIWGDCIAFQQSTPNDKTIQPYTSLVVDPYRSEEIEQTFRALDCFDHLDIYFVKFANRFYKSMIVPIITENSMLIEGVDDFDRCRVLKVESNKEHKRLTYVEVFENLRKLFNFMNVNLKVNIKEDFTALHKLGEFFGEDLVKALVEHCLADTIPSHSTRLEEFDVVIEDTSSFQEYLQAIGILNEDDNTLLDYTKQVEQLCADKTCQTLLEKSRAIMKKDLYDMMDVDIEPSASSHVFECGTHLEPTVKIDTRIFEFPKCKISKSVNELWAVIKKMVDDCAQSTDLCAEQLFCTARSVVEMYCAIVPLHHEQFLETIPQQAALFHNNCMYLAHCLMTLELESHQHLPKVLQSPMTTFVDQVTEVRSVGTTTFLTYLKMQRDQLLSIILNSGIATLREKRAVAPDTEKAIRQCLRQLELLKTVWFNVLPVHVYCKSIGCLVNSFVDDLIIRVTSVEDIPAEMATHLGQIFEVVTARAPVLFPEPNEIHRHVSKWAKFLELIIVLAASMKEITDRWANGKGPLALHFTPDQVRQLIRSLFQNTDRRAAVLGSIK